MEKSQSARNIRSEVQRISEKEGGIWKARFTGEVRWTSEKWGTKGINREGMRRELRRTSENGEMNEKKGHTKRGSKQQKEIEEEEIPNQTRRVLL
jgi:hypothetical protein